MTQLFSTPRWRPGVPTDVVSFDCDATLSSIEGIDWMAEQTGHGPAVEAMTYVAMRETGINPSLYSDRLELVRPSQSLIETLSQAYYEHATPDAQAVIDALKAAGKTICILSAGLHQSVRGFATHLGVEHENVHAVPLIFSAEGEYVDYDKTSPFINMEGKGEWLEANFPDVERLHIGDGLNDISVKEVGVHLVGFGGGQLHPHIARHCSRYIVHNSLAPLLSLVLTQEEVNQLDPVHQEAVAKGDKMISQQGVRFEATPGAGVC
jgi:phosphoserine phosphatase